MKTYEHTIIVAPYVVFNNSINYETHQLENYYKILPFWFNLYFRVSGLYIRVALEIITK